MIRHSFFRPLSLRNRRNFLSQSFGLSIGLGLGFEGGLKSFVRAAELDVPLDAASEKLAADRDKALVGITLDLEMSRNFPTRETMHWDYEKGNLNQPTKHYTVEACRRVKQRGGVIHCFVVGRVFEQENIDWLKQISEAGHPLGNHTYDHVYLLATKTEELQFRFQRAPWLISGQTPADVIRENIRMTSIALKSRAGVTVNGFRTPGGFANGLKEREDIQQLLLDLGFDWVSSLYPPHPPAQPDKIPDEKYWAELVKAHQDAQPFVYPSGLVEVPMSPISDIGAFRTGQWKLDYFLQAIRRVLKWTIEHRAVFDFLAHPSCLYVVDPEFRSIDLICDMVEQSQGKATLTDLRTIARRARLQVKS